MRIYLFILSVFFISQSCVKSNEESKSLSDFSIKVNDKYCFKNADFKYFVSSYIDLPENCHRKIFTLYIDQRMDTLLFTIWKYPDNTISLDNSFGYFCYKGKIILLYSPFFKFFEMPINPRDKQEIIKLYKDEFDYYLTHKQESVMWQLQMAYHSKTVNVLKDYEKIYNTTKPPIPHIVKVFRGE